MSTMEKNVKRKQELDILGICYIKPLASFALGRFFLGVVYGGRLSEKVILSTTSWSSAGSRCA